MKEVLNDYTFLDYFTFKIIISKLKDKLTLFNNIGVLKDNTMGLCWIDIIIYQNNDYWILIKPFKADSEVREIKLSSYDYNGMVFIFKSTFRKLLYYVKKEELICVEDLLDQFVYHARYGEGVVTGFEKEHSSLYINIYFFNFGKKTVAYQSLYNDKYFPSDLNKRVINLINCFFKNKLEFDDYRRDECSKKTVFQDKLNNNLNVNRDDLNNLRVFLKDTYNMNDTAIDYEIKRRILVREILKNNEILNKFKIGSNEIWYIGIYTPKNIYISEGIKIHNSKFSLHSQKILDLKDGSYDAALDFYNTLDKIISKNVIICTVPPHYNNEYFENNYKGIRLLARMLIENKRGNGLDCLIRYKTINKLSFHGSDRSIDVHLNSIRLENGEKLKNKNIILLDDIATSGNSIAACIQILEKANPNIVIPIVLGFTSR